MNKNILLFFIVLSFSLCTNQKITCGAALSAGVDTNRVATLKKLNAAMADYDQKMQEYVFESFKKAGVSSKVEGDVVISAANKKKVDALVYKIFDQYIGLRSYGQLRSFPFLGSEIYAKMSGIIGDLQTQFEWFVKRLTKNQKSVSIILKVLGDMRTYLIANYCDLVVNLQKITGNNYSTIKFESGKIVPQAWFAQMARELRKDLVKIKKDFGQNPSADMKLDKLISADVLAFKQAALFAPSERELKKEADQLATRIKTNFKIYIENN